MHTDMALSGLPPILFSTFSNTPPPRSSSEPLATIRKDGSAFEAEQPFSKDDSHLVKVRGHKTSSVPSVARHDPARALGYSPQQLLNPKGYDVKKNSETFTRSLESAVSKEPASSHADVAFTFDSAHTESSNDEDQCAEPPQTGLGSMIERAHNVSERESRPAKRVKVEHGSENGEDSKIKSKFTGGTKGSELGEYIRNGRQEGAQTAGPPSTAQVVDLTEG